MSRFGVKLKELQLACINEDKMIIAAYSTGISKLSIEPACVQPSIAD